MRNKEVKMEQKHKSVSPFSNENRNLYVVEHLTSAMFELLEDKKFADISISELCDRAGVGRTSFYRNFAGKEDIVRKYLKKILSKWHSSYFNSSADSTEREIVLSLFRHIEANQKMYELLNRRHLIFLLKDILLELSGFDCSKTMLESYASAYVAYTLYGFVEVWFMRGMKDSIDDLVALIPDSSKDAGNCPK